MSSTNRILTATTAAQFAIFVHLRMQMPRCLTLSADVSQHVAPRALLAVFARPTYRLRRMCCSGAARRAVAAMADHAGCLRCAALLA